MGYIILIISLFIVYFSCKINNIDREGADWSRYDKFWKLMYEYATWSEGSCLLNAIVYTVSTSLVIFPKDEHRVFCLYLACVINISGSLLLFVLTYTETKRKLFHEVYKLMTLDVVAYSLPVIGTFTVFYL